MTLAAIHPGYKFKNPFRGDTVTVIRVDRDSLWPVYGDTPKGPGRWTIQEAIDNKIEDQPRPLGLQPGDKVVNLKTGREGLVLKGPVSGVLKVYDQKPPIRDAVPAQALEEYEFWHPGTYDVWRRVTEKKKAQPW